MAETNQIEITTNEMVASLALCGYDRVASQMLNEYNLIENDDEFYRFVEQSELLLRQRGYWDENRDTQLASGLENLLHLLVQSRRKVRCVKGKNVLFLHRLNQEYLMTQKVSGNEHAFTFYQKPFPIVDLLIEFYDIKDKDSEGDEALKQSKSLMKCLTESISRILL